MALRSALQRYKTLSRPKIGGAQSTYFSSLAKKTQAAEDDVVDHNYTTGLLSAEAYLNELTKRTSRPGLTPLQTTNLKQKMESTREDYNDSIMQNAYKAGTVSDRDMYQYEKDKLDKMTAADGSAFQSQQAKVTGLLDKAQKNERKTYRMNETLRISKLPEDRSDLLTQKASLYKQLWDQAIADGDTEDAKSLETSYNNYTLASQKAGVSDQVSKVMGEIAGSNQNIPYYDETGDGSVSGATPSPANGAGQSGGAVATAVPSAGISAGEGVSTASDAVTRAQESYRKAVIRDQNIQQDMTNTQKQIAALESAQKQYKSMGAVDQADAVATQVQNLRNRLSDLKDARSGNLDTISEAKSRIGEAQSSAAYSSTFTSLQSTENVILDREANLDMLVNSGQITKEEYLKGKRDLTQQKVELYRDYGTMYQTYDKTNQASDMVRKAMIEENKNLRVLTTQQNNPHRFELVEDSDGSIKLTDVYSQKTAKTFDGSYLKDGNVFRRVYVPGQADENGVPLGLSSSDAKSFAIQNDLAGEDSMFVTKIVDGQMVEIPVTLVDGKPMYKEEVKRMIQGGSVKVDGNKGYQTIKAGGPGVGKVMGDIFASNAQKTKDALAGIAGAVPGAVQKVGQGILDTSPAYRQSQGKEPYQYTPVAVPDLKKIFGGATDSVTKLLKNVQANPQVQAVEKTVSQSPLEALGIKGANAGTILGNLGQGVQNLISKFVPKVEAKGKVPAIEKPLVKQSGFPVAQSWDEMVKQATQIAYEYGIPPEVMISQMALESGRGTSNRAKQNQLFGVGVYNDNSAGHRYSTPEESMRGYAKLLTTDPRYAKALQVKDDPTAFIRAVKAAGYAADPDYVRKIMSMPEFRANYEKFRPVQEPTISDMTDVVPPESNNWYDGIVKGVKSLLPGQVQAAGPTQSSSAIRSVAPASSPAVQRLSTSVPKAMATPTFAQTPSSSAQLRTPAPAIKLPSIPSYNPVQTFQSNVQKATSAVKNVASNVGNTVKNVLSKLKFW